jgi:4-diphosphocytidyl-2-C-methyl-D-erythritol kinase
LYQSVENALFELSGFSEARLTGTGACVFAVFDCEAKAREACKALQNKWQVYLAKGINRSPLLTKLEKF